MEAGTTAFNESRNGGYRVLKVMLKCVIAVLLGWAVSKTGISDGWPFWWIAVFYLALGLVWGLFFDAVFTRE